MATLALAKQAAEVANQPGHYSLLPADLPLLLTGATGLISNWPDSRIASYDSLPAGPYPLVTAKGGSLYDTYGGSPVHRFYQMWQQLDCDATKANKQNPSGCQADLFPWVEETVSAGSNGAAPANPLPVPLLKEGNIALGFYNVAKGDVPYLTKLAREYTINDNYHQPVMGGTFANEMMVGYADALYYADSNGNPATPPAAQIENPNPLNGTNNWYTNDGYGNVSTKIGGSYTDCSDAKQPGVAAIVNYLKALNVSPNCEKGAYYLLNNYVPPTSAAVKRIRSTTARSRCRQSSSSAILAIRSIRPKSRGPGSASAGPTSRRLRASAPTTAQSIPPPISSAISAVRFSIRSRS